MAVMTDAELTDQDRMYSRERVARGAALLDEKKPGWERLVDLSILDISSGENCICGQVFMQEALAVARYHVGYMYAVDNVLPNDMASYYYGFSAPYDGDAWVELIKQRFDTGTLSDMV